MTQPTRAKNHDDDTREWMMAAGMCGCRRDDRGSCEYYDRYIIDWRCPKHGKDSEWQKNNPGPAFCMAI